MLSALIISVRAFQPGAVPMEQWSGWSWVWMTMPYWSSAFFGTVGVITWAALAAWASQRRY